MAIMHDRIKKLRNDSGLTLAQIAEKLDVTEATAQRYESAKGIKTIPYESIEKYADIFNCTPQYIMGWDGEDKAKSTEYISIGERIKQRRVELGISQEELANMLGYKSRSSIAKIECEDSGLPRDKIKEIATALNTDPSYIMGWNKEGNASAFKINAAHPAASDFILKVMMRMQTDSEFLSMVEAIWSLTMEQSKVISELIKAFDK